MMGQAKWALFNGFLQKEEQQMRKQLLSYLSPNQKEHLAVMAPTQEKIIGLTPLHILFSKIHPSWFVSFLRNMSTEEIHLYLSSFSNENFTWLQKALLFDEKPLSLKTLAKVYFREKLMKNLIADFDLLP